MPLGDMVCLDGQADTKCYRNCWLVDMKGVRRMKNLASPVTEGYLSETCAALPYTTVVMEISLTKLRLNGCFNCSSVVTVGTC